MEHVIQRVRASFGETEVENETDEVQTEIADNTPKAQTDAPLKVSFMQPRTKMTPQKQTSIGFSKFKRSSEISPIYLHAGNLICS